MSLYFCKGLTQFWVCKLKLSAFHFMTDCVLDKADLTLSQRQILDFSKLKDSADDNFKFDKNGRKFSKWVENAVEKEKLLIKSNFSFSHSVFKRLIMETRENQGLFGKELTLYKITNFRFFQTTVSLLKTA